MNVTRTSLAGRAAPSRLLTTTALLAGLLVGVTGHVWAQSPTLTVPSTVVVPGQSVTVTVEGVPGASFALLGSPTNAGMSYAGVALSVGADFRVLAIGTLDAAGLAAVDVTPPFLGATLDRFYLQAATSPSAAFTTISPSAYIVLVNADLARNIERPAMHSGVGPPPDEVGLAGDLYFDASTRTIYGPKSGTAWAASGVSLGGTVLGPGFASGTMRTQVTWGVDTFDVIDFSWGAYQPPPRGPGVSGRPTLGPLTFTRIPDATSTKLLEAASRGTRVPTVRLAVTRTDTQAAVYTLVLTDVRVTNYDQRDDRESVALQAVGVTLTVADPLPYPTPPTTRFAVTFPGRLAADVLEAGTGIQTAGGLTTAGGAPTARALAKGFSIRRNPDGYSDDLVRMIAGSGIVMPAIAAVTKDASTGQPYIRHTLSRAFLTSFQVRGSAFTIEESLGLSYEELRSDMIVNGVTTSTCWNFTTNRRC